MEQIVERLTRAEREFYLHELPSGIRKDPMRIMLTPDMERMLTEHRKLGITPEQLVVDRRERFASESAVPTQGTLAFEAS